MTKSTTDHIVYDSTDSEFRCRHCEDKSLLQDGATAELCLMRLRGFLLMHKLCQPKAVPSPQLALPHTEPRKPVEYVDFGGPDPFADPPVQHAPSPDYGTGSVTVATCWSELWPRLEEALAPHEYNACKEWTPFADDTFNSATWDEMAAWAARWCSTEAGPIPRPTALANAVYAAVSEAQKRHAAAAAASEPKPRKKRARKAAA